jgi:helix-turn-helix protein
MTKPVPSDKDRAKNLRGRFAEQQVHRYEVAPLVGLHPAYLGNVLNGHRPLTPELAKRIADAIDRVAIHVESRRRYGAAGNDGGSTSNAPRTSRMRWNGSERMSPPYRSEPWRARNAPPARELRLSALNEGDDFLDTRSRLPKDL